MGKVGIAASPAAQDKLRKHEKRKGGQHERDAKALAENPAFRRWLWWWIDIKLNVHGLGPHDPHQLARHEGRRSAGVDMLAELRSLAPDAYALMVAEQMAALADEQLHRKAAEAAADEED